MLPEVEYNINNKDKYFDLTENRRSVYVFCPAREVFGGPPLYHSLSIPPSSKEIPS